MERTAILTFVSLRLTANPADHSLLFNLHVLSPFHNPGFKMELPAAIFATISANILRQVIAAFAALPPPNYF
jgi:hypothetical protein